MNPDLRDLRVAVVPTETGNGIDQSSTVEQILACDETRIFSVADYFQAQNDEDIDLLHWSFLINIKTNANLTGTNTDGIDYFSEQTKEGKIRRIKSILENWGNTTSGELQLDHSPLKSSIGEGKSGVVELVEYFNHSDIGTIVYQNEQEIDENFYSYEELDEDLIDEILNVMENYDVDMEKTMERSRD
jgi:hypothetical protein